MDQCDICQYYKRVQPSADDPRKNECYLERRHTEQYKPFKKSNQVIPLTCRNFSHVKTAILYYRGGGRQALRATPEQPRLELPGMSEDDGTN